MTILAEIRDHIHRYREQFGDEPTVLLLTTERYDELNETKAFQAMRLFGRADESPTLRFGDMQIMMTLPDLLEGGVGVTGERELDIASFANAQQEVA